MKQPAAANIIILITAVLVAACQPAPAVTVDPTVTPTLEPTATTTSSPTPTLTPEPTATPIPPPPEQIGPDSYPSNVNPLTGLIVDDPAILQRRPLLIKISNAPPIVRPQSGTSSADVLFEHYAEGGWTRFSGLFYGADADHIGPVRSARLIDLQLAPSFDALFAFSGASNGVIDTIRNNEILYPYNAISPQFGYGEPYFVRFLKPGLPIEHTMFTTTEILREWATLKAVREEPQMSSPGWAFKAAPPPGGTPASSIHITYWQTEVDWHYDPLSGRYLRWTDGIPHTDATTGEQLAFENVIVLSAYHSLIELFPEKYAGEETSWYIDLYDFGPVTLMRDGQSYPGRWERAEERDMLQFLGIDSQPLLLKPGRTFVQVISRSGGPYLRTGPEELILEP